MTPPRDQSIAQAVQDARIHVATAARSVDREPDAVTIIGVTKTFPASDARALVDAGITSLGENKAQELLVKSQECADLRVEWHFIGQLQRNKVGGVVSCAQVIESVDRPVLVPLLERHAKEQGKRPKCLVQVNLDPVPVPGRGGIHPKDALDLAELLAQSQHLSLAGLMGVASRERPAVESFAQLAQVRAALIDRYPQATMMSAGMSGDFPVAIAAGATHVRLGATLLGQRPNLR